MLKKSKSLQGDTTMDTIIGTHTQIEGNIHSVGNLRIEGKIKGSIRCEADIYIGTYGCVHSNIFAGNVIIAGEVFGDVKAVDHITIEPTGKLTGNIESPRLIFKEGGEFNGTSSMKLKSIAVDSDSKDDSAESPSYQEAISNVVQGAMGQMLKGQADTTNDASAESVAGKVV